MRRTSIHFTLVCLLLIPLLIAASMLHAQSITCDASPANVATPALTSDYGDAYANSFLPARSMHTSYEDNAIGAPDGLYAEIYFDYSNGHLTLDMGEQEEIVNGSGDDFTIISRGGNYTVFVGFSFDSPLSNLGHANGTHSFDLSDIGMEIARYVRVEYRLGDTVELDAIEAINYNAPTSDIYDPQISGPEDFWVWANQSLIQLEWQVFDHTPHNSTVLVNGSVEETNSWDGSDVLVSIPTPGVGRWNVTLLLYDLSGNSASDTVIVEVRAVSMPVDLTLLFGGVAVGAVLIIVVILYYVKFRR